MATEDTALVETSPRAQQIIAQILELKRTVRRQTVEQLARIGERLAELKRHLAGNRRWMWALKHELQISHDAAEGYIQLYAWSRAKPGLFDRLKELGVGKARPLLELPWKDAAKIVNRKEFLLPGREQPLTLEQMTDRQFQKVLAKHVPAVVRRDPTGTLHGLLFRLRRFRERIEEAGAVAGRARASARASLREEITRFEAALASLRQAL